MDIQNYFDKMQCSLLPKEQCLDVMRIIYGLFLRKIENSRPAAVDHKQLVFRDFHSPGIIFYGLYGNRCFHMVHTFYR